MTINAVLAASGDVSIFATPEFWVMIAFFLFVGLLLYYSVPHLVGKMLDDRADAIRKNLDEARKMREDAQALLSDYHRKAAEAETEAQKIVEQAKHEGESLRAEAERKAVEVVARRVKLAEEKIARAERQAISEVRGAAVDAAIKSAERLLSEKASGETGQRLIDASINDLKSKLN
jgi:F-type H+-transporting ATPase subunit b